MNTEKDNKLALFEGRQIRKAFHKGEWWFSIIDVVEVLVGGDRPRKYWNDLKKKLLQEGYDQLSEKIGQLKMQSSDGKLYETDCAGTETLFRTHHPLLAHRSPCATGHPQGKTSRVWPANCLRAGETIGNRVWPGIWRKESAPHDAVCGGFPG